MSTSGLPEHVVGDAARLRQVLLNLAGNAIKFTEQRRRRAHRRARRWPDEIRFRVRDTGIGIAPEEQARIFLEFEQADGGTARKFGGTGLGLAISKRIVERMGGRIAVESAPGAGSTFAFTVPLPRAADEASAAFAPPDLHGKAVLIVAPARDRGLAAGAAARALGRQDLRRSRRAGGRGAAARTAVGRDAGRSRARREAATAVLRARRATHRAPHRAGHAGRAARARGAQGSGLHRLSGQAGARRVTRRAARGEPRRRSRRPATPRRAADAYRSRARGLAILVAEDNEINALLARALLDRLGHRPTIAASGEAAVEAWLAAQAAGTPYDLVLMDVHMPGIDGIEAARRIRAAESRARRAAHADHRAHRQRARRGARGLPRRRHGRVPDQAARPRAAGERAGLGAGARVDGGVAHVGSAELIRSPHRRALAAEAAW